MKDQECSVPKPSEERGDVESVSSFPQHGNVVSAQPTVDGPGFEAGPNATGRWVGNGPSLKFIESK